MQDKQETRERDLHLVTGAFGYSGSYIASALLEAGHRVGTLTSRNGAGHALCSRVEARPLNFDRPDELRESMARTRVLYNTYWVRFSKAGFSQNEAIANTKLLFECAREAGVERIVHVSITNPSLESPYEYFRGKAELERALQETGIPHTILRPAVLFGGDDILINNIAWSLRYLPVFGVFGDGQYQLQPIHVEDLARLALRAGAATGSETVHAVGSEAWPYRELVKAIAKAIGVRRLLVPVPTWFGMLAARVLGFALRDVLLTREEIEALMDNLLVPDKSVEIGPNDAVQISLGKWMTENAETLGRKYANELARRDRRLRLPVAEETA
jgi:NADH dehydrogenase